MKQLDDILKRLESLEARIAKLEKAPTTAPSNNSNREVITEKKYIGNSGTTYYLTSEGRVLSNDGYYYSYVGDTGYLLRLEQTLIEIGEEDAIEISDLTAESLKEAKDKNTDRYKKFITQLTRLATKYGSKGVLPALLPNDTVLYTGGNFIKTEVTKKAIKF